MDFLLGVLGIVFLFLGVAHIAVRLEIFTYNRSVMSRRHRATQDSQPKGDCASGHSASCRHYLVFVASRPYASVSSEGEITLQDEVRRESRATASYPASD